MKSKLLNFAVVGVALFSSSSSFANKVQELYKGAESASYAVRSGLINAVVAKELCSCHFVAGLPTDLCLKRANLPQGSTLFFTLTVNDKNGAITSEVSPLALNLFGNGPQAEAVYDAKAPRYGCRLVRGPVDFN